MSNKQIQQLYDTQKSRINRLVQVKIDMILEKLPKYVDNITMDIIKDIIPSYYFDRDNLIIIDDSEDFEDRIEEIKDVVRLKDTSDDAINDDIDDIISKIIIGE
jgi:hypothetical protein